MAYAHPEPEDNMDLQIDLALRSAIAPRRSQDWSPHNTADVAADNHVDQWSRVHKDSPDEGVGKPAHRTSTWETSRQCFEPLPGIHGIADPLSKSSRCCVVAASIVGYC